MAREVAGGARPRDLLHAQEYPVLNGLPPTDEGGILGPGLLCLDELVVKETEIGARNPTQQPVLHGQRPPPTRGFRMFNVGDGTPVGDASDDRLRLRAQETLQPSTDRRGVVGVVGPAAQLA